MTRRIFPLNAMRAFEASARQLSFVGAAEELHVTPAAISHQVKRLEEYLGMPLFRRMPRGLLLTETGQVLFSGLREAFQQLDRAMERIQESASRGALTISVAPIFAVKWLVPRLQDFEIRHPDIDLRMSASLGLIDFQRDDFDAAIRFGSGKYPGLEAVKLFDESVTPMCSPGLLKNSHRLDSPADLEHFVLLHNDSTVHSLIATDWGAWLKAAGLRHVDAARGPHFSQPDHALQAAIDGAGVVLGWRGMAADDLQAGRLVQPFDLQVPLGSACYLVYPEAYKQRRKLVVFKQWLLQALDHR